AKLLGLGLPIIAATGMLSGWVLSGPISFMLGTGTVGIAGVVKAGGDALAAKRSAESHPFYFLWEAQRHRR
ncbi:MAG: hypothetical protein PVI86_11870, partial [Phycisphaerae bacterium]